MAVGIPRMFSSRGTARVKLALLTQNFGLFEQLWGQISPPRTPQCEASRSAGKAQRANF